MEEVMMLGREEHWHDEGARGSGWLCISSSFSTCSCDPQSTFHEPFPDSFGVRESSSGREQHRISVPSLATTGVLSTAHEKHKRTNQHFMKP